MATIILVDDHHVVRQSFRLLLEAIKLSIAVFCVAKYRELLRKIP